MNCLNFQRQETTQIVVFRKEDTDYSKYQNCYKVCKFQTLIVSLLVKVKPMCPNKTKGSSSL